MANSEITRLVYTLQQEIGDLRKQVKTLQSTPALRHASIEDTSIPVLDADGRITSVLGRQQDGSSGVRVVRSPFQPMPSKPIVTSGSTSGTAVVKWDGGTHFGDPVPVVHGHVEVWAYLLGHGEEPFPAPNPGAERLATIRDRAGGEVAVSVASPGTWAVWLRMVGQDRETTGDWSPSETFKVVPLVDVADIEARIQAFADGGLLDDAAYDNLMARLGEFLMVRTGQIEANAIDGMTITGPTVQSHTAADTGWKIRVGTGYQAWDTSGTETVRIDGVANFLRGSIHAGVADQAEIHLDYGEKTIATGEDEDGEPEQITTFDTPYIEFRDGTEYVIRPMISLGENGHLLIRPGSLPSTPRYRAPLNIAGDLHVNRVEAREQVRTRNGFRVNTGTTSQPGGVMRDSTRTRLQGRMADTHGPHDMIIRGSSPETITDPGFGSRGTLTFDEPVPTGVRICIVSGHVANTSWGYDNNRGVIASSSAASASSMRYTRRAPSDNNGPVQNWVYYTAYWV